MLVSVEERSCLEGVYTVKSSEMHGGEDFEGKKSCGREYTVCSRFWSGQVASGAIAGEEEHGYVSAP